VGAPVDLLLCPAFVALTGATNRQWQRIHPAQLSPHPSSICSVIHPCHTLLLLVGLFHIRIEHRNRRILVDAAHAGVPGCASPPRLRWLLRHRARAADKNPLHLPDRESGDSTPSSDQPFPSLTVYPVYLVYPWITWVVFSIALDGFGIIFHYIHVLSILLCYLCSCQDH
jgi:hypothetical protein